MFCPTQWEYPHLSSQGSDDLDVIVVRGERLLRIDSVDNMSAAARDHPKISES